MTPAVAGTPRCRHQGCLAPPVYAAHSELPALPRLVGQEWAPALVDRGEVELCRLHLDERRQAVAAAAARLSGTARAAWWDQEALGA